jgi:glucose-6-phosphate isomerase
MNMIKHKEHYITKEYMDLELVYEKNCGIERSTLKEILGQLAPVQKHLASVHAQQGYNESTSCINLPFDAVYHAEIMACVVQKKALHPRLILLIGIGGSNLGTCALYEALRGVYYNEAAQAFGGPLFYCADTLDVDKNKSLKVIVENVLKQGDYILIISVSKSGTTMETTLNTDYFIELLQQYHPKKYQDYVVVITDQNSVAWHRAETEGYAKLAIPKQVGGRFSVFSAVGLFPLAMLGVDIDALCSGARDTVNASLDSLESDAAISAAILWNQYQQGRFIHDSFFFDAAFETVGKWYRQLMAESLGKDGKGMLPTVSMGTVDLHSMAQLYFGGPHNRFTTFFPAMVPEHENGPMASMQNVIVKAVQEAYGKAGLPFVTFHGLEKNEKQLGALLQFKMLEIIFLGYLMQVNVFNQPQVELYKQEVRRLLL